MASAGWLSDKLSRVDVYRTVLFNSDPRLRLLSRVKSWMFICLYSVFALVLITYYVTTPQTRAVTLLQPSLDAVTKLMSAGETPSCACASTMSGGQAIDFSLPRGVDYVRGNQCAGIMHVMGLATDPVSRLTGIPFITLYLPIGSNASRRGSPNITLEELEAGLALKFAFQPMYRMCIQMATAVSDAVQNVAQESLGAVLIAEDALTDHMYRVVYGAFKNVAITGDTLQLSLETLTIANLLAYADASLSATVRTPANCSCSLRYLAAQNDSLDSLNPCAFRPVYDPSTERNQHYSCSIANNVLQFPLELLQGQGLPTLFRVESAVQMPDTTSDFNFFYEVLVYPVYSFVLAPPNTASWSRPRTLLRPNVMRVNYAKYFAACKPASCTYLVTAPISGVEVLTTLFGIMGGALTMIWHLVGILGTLCARHVLKMDLPKDEESALRRTQSGKTVIGNITLRRIGTEARGPTPTADMSTEEPDSARMPFSTDDLERSGNNSARMQPAHDSPVRRMLGGAHSRVAPASIKVEELSAGFQQPPHMVATLSEDASSEAIVRNGNDAHANGVRKLEIPGGKVKPGAALTLTSTPSFYAPTAAPVSARGGAPVYEPAHATPRTQPPRSILKGSAPTQPAPTTLDPVNDSSTTAPAHAPSLPAVEEAVVEDLDEMRVPDAVPAQPQRVVRTSIAEPTADSTITLHPHETSPTAVNGPMSAVRRLSAELMRRQERRTSTDAPPPHVNIVP